MNRIAIGGMFRCCIAHINELESYTPVQAPSTTNCQHCKAELQLTTDNIWHWVSEQPLFATNEQASDYWASRDERQRGVK